MTIDEIFQTECQGLEIDRAFFKKLCLLEAGFVNKKQDHIEFFGGNLTGVNVVRFTNDDRDKLFIDILGADDRALNDELLNLKDENGTKVFDSKFIVSSDVFNISCIWLMHAINKSPHLDTEQRKEATIRVCLYLFYKFLTSRLGRHFQYPANKELAQAVYEQLSFKFSLKQHGSWSAALRDMATTATSLTGLHGKTIKNLDNDHDVPLMINNLQGRIRSMLKNIYREVLKIKHQGGKIARSSSFIESDGEMVLKDRVSGISEYGRYIKTVIPDSNSFIKTELMAIISSVVKTIPDKPFLSTLKWVSNNYATQHNHEIENMVDIVLDHAFDYLSKQKDLLRNKDDITSMLAALKGAYMSSRSTDVRLFDIRKTVGELVVKATGIKNESTMSSVRTGLMLYVCLRAFTRKHYTN